MDQEMDELKKELTLLIWEQIYKFKIWWVIQHMDGMFC